MVPALSRANIHLFEDLLLALDAILLFNGINITNIRKKERRRLKRVVTYFLELLDQGVVDLAVHGGKNTFLGDGTVENLLDGDGAGNTDFIG